MSISESVAEMMRESLSRDDESPDGEDDAAPLPGARELNRLIDQLLLVLENVRIRRLHIEIEYPSATLDGDEAILSVQLPSFEYSDITRHAASAGEAPPSPQAAAAAHAPSEWNPAALIKCLRFPALTASLDRKQVRTTLIALRVHLWPVLSLLWRNAVVLYSFVAVRNSGRRHDDLGGRPAPQLCRRPVCRWTTVRCAPRPLSVG